MGQVARALIVVGVVGVVIGIIARIAVPGALISLGFISFKHVSILLISNSLILAGLGIEKLSK